MSAILYRRLMTRDTDSWRSRYGLAAAFQRWTYRLVQRVMILDVTYLMVMDTQETSHQPPCHEGIRFRFLDEHELEGFAADRRHEIDRSMAGRVRSGRDFCYAALCRGELVSYCWLAMDSIEPNHNRGARHESGVGMSFSENAAFIYKGFTRSDYRGRGIYPALMQRVCVAMRNKGIRYILSTTEWTNLSALRGCQRSGKKRLGMIWRFGWRSWMRTMAAQTRLDQLSVCIGDATMQGGRRSASVGFCEPAASRGDGAEYAAPQIWTNPVVGSDAQRFTASCGKPFGRIGWFLRAKPDSSGNGFW